MTKNPFVLRTPVACQQVCTFTPSARLPKPPVGFDDANDHELLADILHKHELTILKELRDHESRATQLMEQQRAALCKVIEDILVSRNLYLTASPSQMGETPLNTDAVGVAMTGGDESTASLGRDIGKPDRTHSLVSTPGASQTPCASPGRQSRSKASQYEQIQSMSRAKVNKTQKKITAKNPTMKRRGANHLHKLCEIEMKCEQESMQNLPCPPLQRFVRDKLDHIVSVAIALASLVTYLQMQIEGCKSNEALGVGSCRTSLIVDGGELLSNLELVFNVVFVCELLLRLAVLRKTALRSKVFLMDAAIVFVSLSDSLVFARISESDDLHVGFVRILRCARFVKTIRIIRELTVFRPLRVLTITILHSFSALAWSMVLLCGFQLIAALLLCQSLTLFIQNESNDYEIRIWVNRMYGSSTKAFYTMFEVTLSGCWPQYVRPLIENVSPWYGVFYLAYVVVVVFALIRIMTALFLKETLAVAAEDAELEVEHAKKKRRQLEDRLLELFELADSSGDGNISLEEFTKTFDDPAVKTWCKMLDIHVKEACTLFDLIDDGDGEISYAEFLEGISRLRGNATSQDVVSILHDCHHILESCEAIRIELSERRMKEDMGSKRICQA